MLKTPAAGWRNWEQNQCLLTPNLELLPGLQTTSQEMIPKGDTEENLERAQPASSRPQIGDFLATLTTPPWHAGLVRAPIVGGRDELRALLWLLACWLTPGVLLGQSQEGKKNRTKK